MNRCKEGWNIVPLAAVFVSSCKASKVLTSLGNTHSVGYNFILKGASNQKESKVNVHSVAVLLSLKLV